MEDSKLKTWRIFTEAVKKIKKKRYVKLFACFLILISLIITTSCYWLPQVADFLIVNDQLVKSDVIIAPSGSTYNLRIEYAAEIYKKGYAPRLLLSGQLALQEETGINLAKKYIESLGVPEKDIIVEDDSGSTYENALFSKKIIEKKSFKSVILVTSPTHTRRTKKIFKEILPKETEIIVCCNPEDFDVSNWWQDRNRAREVVYEYFAYFWYFLFKT